MSVTSSATHILELFLFITSQANTDTVKMEREVGVGEEDCIHIKTEEVYGPSGRIIKTEYEVSVTFSGSCLFTYVCVFYCTFPSVTHLCDTCISHLFSLCMLLAESAGYSHVILHPLSHFASSTSNTN